MSLESFSEPPVVEQENRAEDSLQSKLEEIKDPSIVERLKKWARVAAVIGVSFSGGKYLYEDHAQTVEYDTYLESTLTPDDIQELDTLNQDIAKYFGEGAVGKLKQSDKQAYFRRKKADVNAKTEYDGFDDLEVDKKVVDALIGSESFPKKWIDGEVKRIRYVDVINNEAHADYRYFFDTITFYNKGAFKKNVQPSELVDFIRDFLGHELGHANDWDSDTESDIKVRTKLLSQVIKRLDAEDRVDSVWARKRSNSQVSHDELYKYAREYWAEICSRYFSFPASLQLEHKEDFDLVNNFVLSQDPNFNVFEKAGPYFDAQGNPTQKVLDLVK